MIRPHEIDEKKVLNPAAQKDYETRLDRALSSNDFDANPALFIEDPPSLTCADQAEVLRQYREAYQTPDGQMKLGWIIETGQAGVFFRLPPRG